jgi:hypothetical protein
MKCVNNIDMFKSFRIFASDLKTGNYTMEKCIHFFKNLSPFSSENDKYESELDIKLKINTQNNFIEKRKTCLELLEHIKKYESEYLSNGLFNKPYYDSKFDSKEFDINCSELKDYIKTFNDMNKNIQMKIKTNTWIKNKRKYDYKNKIETQINYNNKATVIINLDIESERIYCGYIPY